MSRRIPSLLAAAAAVALLAPRAEAQRIAHAAEAPKGATTAAVVRATTAAAAADTLRPRPGATPEGATGVLTFDRESYSYARDGRRDPFSSLLDNGELRPMISDLHLAVIAYDPQGGSVAVLRDVNTKEQYRVRVGQQLGRMRVASIEAKRITFTIEEFGFSRQETLALSDTTTPRTQQ
jgi:hypothetical protein